MSFLKSKKLFYNFKIANSLWKKLDPKIELIDDRTET